MWGGDWNHALSGRECSGSTTGRQSILEAMSRLGLAAPTHDLPHQLPGLLSVDHVAVPAGWSVAAAEHHIAGPPGRRISDHDAYVVQAVPA